MDNGGKGVMKHHFSPHSLLPVALGALVGIILILFFKMGVPPLVLAVALAGLLVLMMGVIYLNSMIRLGALRRLKRIYKRLEAGEGDAVLAELNARRAGGDRSYQMALVLSTAYAYLGQGEEAELLAYEAWNEVKRRGLCQKTDRPSKYLCDIIMVALSDAWNAQGRYLEAVNFIRGRVSDALQPNIMAFVMTFNLYLAGQDDNARATLHRIEPPAGLYNLKRRLPVKYQFMTAYLRYKLLGEDTRPALVKLRGELANWQAEAERNAANPYGARLREILDDVQAVLPQDG